jgi:triosephosphate isomerase
VGEKLEERDANQTLAVVEKQLRELNNTMQDPQRLVIAYEPVWAIGTGKTATPEMAADAHHFVRGKVAGKFGDAMAAAVRILYGGSVKPDNVRKLMAEEEIDGALVGGRRSIRNRSRRL